MRESGIGESSDCRVLSAEIRGKNEPLDVGRGIQTGREREEVSHVCEDRGAR